MKRITQETVNRAIDYETGEIKHESNSVTYSLQSEPDYIKVYLADLMYLVGLPRHHLNILFWLMTHCNYASDKYGQCVVLSSDFKRDMAETLGLRSIITINNALSKLVKKKVIEHVGRGIYRLNPYLFGRGKWQEVQKLREISSITMHVLYSSKGKEISASIETFEDNAFSLKKHLEELQAAELEEAKAS